MIAECETAEIAAAAPTTLNLFRLRNGEFQGYLDYYLAAVDVANQFGSAENALLKLSQEIEAKQRRLVQTQTELSARAWSRLDSASAGALYLKLFDELSGKDIPPQEIYDFYQRSLIVNSRYYDYVEREGNRNSQVLQALRIIEDPSQNRIAKEFNRLLGAEEKIQPAWFRGNTKEWRKFFQNHTPVGGYLEDFFEKYPHLPRPLSPVFLKPLLVGGTTQDELPEWIEEAEENFPDRSVVENELLNDLQEEIQSAEMVELIERQYHYLESMVNEKTLKAIRHLLGQRRQTFTEVADFTRAVVFLGTSYFVPEFAVDPLDHPDASFKQVGDSIISVEKAQANRIKDLISSRNILMSPESFALWIEKKLQESRIITNTQDVIDERVLKMTGPFFDGVARDTTNPDFQVLRETDKKAFRVLNYEVRPFLEALNRDEILYLQELTTESANGPIEPIIWEMAELISARWQDKDIQTASRHAPKAFDELQRFIKVWLTNNHAWAINHLHERLVEDYRRRNGHQIEDHLPVDELPSLSPVEVQEIEVTIKETQKDILSGWHLYYATDKKLDPESFVEIGDEESTITEREEQFAKFVGKENIPCTIQPPCIIRAFEVILMTPREKEWIRMSKRVNGEIFKKHKHPMGMRTFYVVDPAKKEIVFFVYKKKDWRYRF